MRASFLVLSVVTHGAVVLGVGALTGVFTRQASAPVLPIAMWLEAPELVSSAEKPTVTSTEEPRAEPRWPTEVPWVDPPFDDPPPERKPSAPRLRQPTPPAAATTRVKAVATPAVATEQPVSLPVERVAAQWLEGSNAPPRYPPAARRLSQQGSVLLRLHVDPQGAVIEAIVVSSSGYPLLDRAALAAARQWHFMPARVGQTAVEDTVTQAVVFRLSDS